MRQIIILLLVTTITSCTSSSFVVEKPTVFEFGSSLTHIVGAITPLCSSYEIRSIDPIQLPTAHQVQTQIDCYDFLYAGKPRTIELVFADSTLDLVWILTLAEEEHSLIEAFSKLHGQPSHVREDVAFFLEHGVAVRNVPHEVLFISERLKAPFGAMLGQ